MFQTYTSVQSTADDKAITSPPSESVSLKNSFAHNRTDISAASPGNIETLQAIK